MRAQRIHAIMTKETIPPAKLNRRLIHMNIEAIKNLISEGKAVLGIELGSTRI